MSQDENNTQNSPSQNPENPGSLPIPVIEKDNKTIKMKKSGIIRWGGIVPFVIVTVLVYAYFFLLLRSSHEKFHRMVGL